MANLKSSKRDAIRSEAKKLKNRAIKSKVRNLRKGAIKCITNGLEQDAKLATVKFESAIFSAVNKNIFKKNTAIRYVSRLVHLLKKTFNLYQ